MRKGKLLEEDKTNVVLIRPKRRRPRRDKAGVRRGKLLEEDKANVVVLLHPKRRRLKNDGNFVVQFQSLILGCLNCLVINVTQKNILRLIRLMIFIGSDMVIQLQKLQEKGNPNMIQTRLYLNMLKLLCLTLP